jgi:hypothetical protein
MGVGAQAAADIPLVPRQAVGGVAFEVVPELLDRIELGGVSWDLCNMSAGVGLLHRRDRWPPVNRALIPQQDDLTSPLAQARPQKVGHGHGGEVVRREPDVQAHVPPLRRDRERRQRREPLVLVDVAEDRRLPWRGPRAPARREKEKAALIPEGQTGPQSSGLF